MGRGLNEHGRRIEITITESSKGNTFALKKKFHWDKPSRAIRRVIYYSLKRKFISFEEIKNWLIRFLDESENL